MATVWVIALCIKRKRCRKGLPDIPPLLARGSRRFQDGKLAHEQVHWDQASVLAQLGLLDAEKLPVAGVESARKVLDPTMRANMLIKRARA
jgi:hypothetical protein